MAEEKKTQAKSKAKTTAAKAAAPEGSADAAAAAPGETCRVDSCKQGVRAKGFCRKHYMAWRRGVVGDHHRYKICSKEACRKPRALGGLCEEHAGKATPAEAGAA